MLTGFEKCLNVISQIEKKKSEMTCELIEEFCFVMSVTDLNRYNSEWDGE